MKINSNKIKSLFLLSLVGSNLAKEEKTDNQSELTLNSLPQIGANFTKRESIANRTIAQLVGHINSLSYESNKNDKEPVYSIYYVPVEETLRLLATKENCPMAPLVYNETNAQEYDQLIAQIEIPAKK